MVFVVSRGFSHYRFSPVVFFIVSASSSDPSLVHVELLTYNEQVFQVAADLWIESFKMPFNISDVKTPISKVATFGFGACEEMHTFMVAGLQRLTTCSGIK